MFPFSEVRDGNKRIRKFSCDVDSTELGWHRDAENRRVKVLEAGGWFFQMDNELPIELSPDTEYLIPKETWHRLIKKSTSVDLVVEIYEE